MAVNPFPKGWRPSRLDQGWDGTFTEKVVSPFFGKVVFSAQTVPGWRDGGLIALKRSKDGHVFYFAEGISPTLSKGQRVWPGRKIGTPKRNPYNGIVGNIEWGRANPSQPTEPLAQIVSDKKQMVMTFYQWASKLTGKTATDTSGAGYP